MILQRIKLFLRHIPWAPLIAAAIFLGLAPFTPQPHLVEKTVMLIEGNLIKPIDIFDLLFHLSPVLLLIGKLLAGKGVPDERK